MEVTDVIRLYVVDTAECRVEAAASYFFFTRTCTTLQIKYVSYEYKNNSANRGAQSVSIRIQTNIWKTLYQNTT